MKDNLVFSTDYEKMENNIINLTNEYISSHGIKVLILGLSGGIDSALVAALASKVKVPLIGFGLPIQSDWEEQKRANHIGKAFCNEYCISSLTEWFVDSASRMGILGKEGYRYAVARGNLKARLRMIKLYDEAYHKGGMVLSTDNLTEYLLGFWTLHGDVGDFGMIQQLWKTEVYELSNYLSMSLSGENEFKSSSLKACIDAVPTDGLGITESDFDQIFPEYNKNCHPYHNYKTIDMRLRDHLEDKQSDPNDPVIKKYRETIFKRNHPWNLPRAQILNTSVIIESVEA
jgi:NAD+ synthetase